MAISWSARVIAGRMRLFCNNCGEEDSSFKSCGICRRSEAKVREVVHVGGAWSPAQHVRSTP